MRNIGDTIYWVEHHGHYGKSVPCTMCFGKRFVTIILGDGAHEKSECGFCSHGLDYATGQSKTWEPVAFVRSGIISGVSSRDGIKYEVGYSTVRDSECFDSEEEAIPVRDAKLAEEIEMAAARFKESFVTCKKRQLWSTGYHREWVKYYERQIEWHKMRLGMIKERPTPASKENE